MQHGRAHACASVVQGRRADADACSRSQADPVDFVRQGALVAMALVLMQQPEARVAPFRKQLAKFVGDKHEEVMCRCEPHCKASSLHEADLTWPKCWAKTTAA